MARWFGDCSRIPQEPPSIPGSSPQRNSCEDRSGIMDSGADRQSDSSPRTSRRWFIPRRPYDGQVRPAVYPSSCQENNEAMELTGVKIGPRIRYTPYGIARFRRRDSTHKGDPTQGNVERETKSSEEGMKGNRLDGTNRKSLRVRVPLRVPYDEKVLLDLSQGERKGPFTAGKVAIPEIPLRGPSAAPKEVISKYIEPMKVSKMKQDVHQERDDIQVCELLRCHSDPGVMANDPQLGPNLKSELGDSLPISDGEMPTVLSFNSVGRPSTIQEAPEFNSLDLSKKQLRAQGEGMLDKVNEPAPGEMCAERKPLGTTFPDEPTNVRSVVPSVASIGRRLQPWFAGRTTRLVLSKRSVTRGRGWPPLAGSLPRGRGSGRFPGGRKVGEGITGSMIVVTDRVSWMLTMMMPPSP
ncbi:nuclear RNA export factor 1-like [Echinops telfairi]|uniref:Nuclear RNA export factor 1-like n=1 Tax=Echinops telfairi TaxID=9371 RepID=A0AC55D459_ECHTE|nr:nuclear RNA export factor 1-like [Echinops telfairi]